MSRAMARAWRSSWARWSVTPGGGVGVAGRVQVRVRVRLCACVALAESGSSGDRPVRFRPAAGRETGGRWGQGRGGREALDGEPSFQPASAAAVPSGRAAPPSGGRRRGRQRTRRGAVHQRAAEVLGADLLARRRLDQRRAAEEAARPRGSGKGGGRPGGRGWGAVGPGPDPCLRSVGTPYAAGAGRRPPDGQKGAGRVPPGQPARKARACSANDSKHAASPKYHEKISHGPVASHDDGLVAHGRHIGAARRARPQHDGDLGDARRRHARLARWRASARGEGGGAGARGRGERAV
jgi:hypothetical protein